jgi:hypothetical protein
VLFRSSLFVVYYIRTQEALMMKNISCAERSIRIVIGLGIIGWGIFASNWWGALGLLPIITGLVSFCPLYKMLGVCCPFFKNKEGQGSGCCSTPDKQDKPKSGGCCGCK